MSVVEYLSLRHQCKEEIDWRTWHEWLMLVYKRFIPDGSEEEITDVNSLLAKLEEKSLLGIDRLDILRDLLKRIRKWDLLRMVDEFEFKRKDYKQFLEKISRALEESNELQRLMLICRRQNLIAQEREEHIESVNSLFTELEQQNKLGIGNLSILKTIATEVEKPDLCRLVDDFDEKRKQEEDAERERKEREDYRRRMRAQAVSVLACGINVGERVVGVVTPHCTFRNFIGGAVVVTTWMVLRKSHTMEEFVNAFKGAVLPFGNCLRAISEGSIRFTIQAENVSALEALWQNYQDDTLQKNLQEFLVTEEMKQLAGGEVTLTVYIDEDEYRNAKLDLMISEGEEMKVKEKIILKSRASSDSDISKERKMVTANISERECLPVDRKVEEYLEGLQETYSEITQPSDTGVGTQSSAPSEYGLDKDEGGRLQKLERLEVSFKDVMDNWISFYEAFRDAYPLEGNEVVKMKKEMDRIRNTLKNVKEIERKWTSAETILTSPSSPDVIIQQLKNSLQLEEDYFRKPTSKDKTTIRVLARKAKNLKRMDVFYLLREITPTGTTGPQLPENLLIDEISKQEKENFSRILKDYVSGNLRTLQLLNWSPSDVHTLRMGRNSMDNITKRYGLRTVGELYDFLGDRGLAHVADKL